MGLVNAEFGGLLSAFIVIVLIIYYLGTDLLPQNNTKLRGYLFAFWRKAENHFPIGKDFFNKKVARHHLFDQ